MVQQFNEITLEDSVNTGIDVIRTDAPIESSSTVTDAPVNISGSPASNIALQSEAPDVTFNHNTSVPDSTIDKEHVQQEPTTPSTSIDVPEEESEDISNTAQTVISSAAAIDTGSIVLEDTLVPLDLSINIAVSEPSGATPVVSKQKLAPPEEDNLFSLQSCLRDFTSPEILKGTEKFCCNVCTEKAKRIKATVKKSKEDASPLSLAVSDQQQLEQLTEKLTIEDKGTNYQMVEFSNDSGMNSSSSSSESEREDSRDIESTKESDGKYQYRVFH